MKSTYYSLLFGKLKREKGLEKRINTGTFAWSLTILLVLVIAPFAAAQSVKPEITAAIDAGDTVKAISLLEEQISLDKAYDYNYYLLGTIYFKQEKFARAREQLEIAVDKKDRIESYYQLGLTYLELEQIDQAEKTFKKGRKEAGKDEKYIFDNGLGLVFLARKNYQEADRAFRAAIVGDSAVAEYHINLGDANFYSGVPYLAVKEYEKALELDTAGLEVYFHWAEACLEMRDYNCAMEKLRTVLRKDSTYARAWMRAGEIYFKAAMSSRTLQDRNDRFRETIGSYKRYLELTDAQPDSSNVRVYFGLAMAYLNLRGFEDANTYFDKVLAIPYEPKDIYFYYGRSLWGTRDYVKSGEMLEKHMAWVEQQDEDYRSGVSEEELYQLLGDSWFYRDHDNDADRKSDYRKAIPWYERSLEIDADQQRLVQNLGRAYHFLDDFQNALKYYDIRIEMGLDSSSSWVLKYAGYCAMNIARTASEDTQEELMEEEFVEEGFVETEPAEPVDPVTFYNRAVDYMLRFLEYDPSDSRIVEMTADAYLYRLEDCVNGVKYYQKLLEMEPDNCGAKRALGYAYFGGICEKNFGKAIRYLLDANQCVNGENPCADKSLPMLIAKAYHSRAADRAEAGEDAAADFEQAHNWYGKVLKCEPGNAEAKKGQDDTQFEF